MKVVPYVATSANANTTMKEQTINMVYEVSDVPYGDSAQMALAALTAVDGADSSIAVPLVGQLVVVTNEGVGIEYYVRSTRLSSRGNSAFIVVATLARTYISAAKNVLIEYDTSIRTAVSSYDINNAGITVAVSSTTTIKPAPKSPQSHTVTIYRPVGQLRVQISSASPSGLTAILPVTGAVNNAAWLNAAVGTIRFDGMRATTRESAQWLVELNFSQDHNGWNEIAWFTDPSTGQPDPANDPTGIFPATQATQTTSTGKGMVSVPVNSYQYDFNSSFAGLTTLLTDFGFAFA